MAPSETVGTERESVGSFLRRCRLQTGQNLDAVADDLRIRRRHLDAIENGRYDELPGPTYALGFVRVYAEYFGLDGRQIVERYREERRTGGRTTDLVFPSPVAEGGTPKGGLLLVGLLIAVVAYGVWYANASLGLDVLRLVNPLPDRLLARLDSPVPTVEGTVAAAGTAEPGRSAEPSPPAAVAAADPAGAPTEASEAAVAALATDSGTPAPETAVLRPPPAPAAPAAAIASTGPSADATGAKARIVLQAKDDCWIEIKDGATGKLVSARLLRAGDSLDIPHRPDLRLLAGNAGGLDIVVDGRIAAPLGRPGMVVRDIRLEPDRLAAAPTGEPSAD
jgi:cytoskeleton protein RodZ